MLSSPSDMAQEVTEIRDSLSAWNSSFADRRSIAFVTRDWRRDAVPNLGDSGQAVINAQLLDGADVVFAIFGARLGMATDEYVSGTAEEIRRANDAGKAVHVYFCNRPVPMDHDPEQLAAVRKFKYELDGLYGEFMDLVELRPLVWRDIENDIERLVDGPAQVVVAQRPVQFSAQPQSERLAKGYSKAGKMQYETRRWVELTNNGTEDALEVSVEPAEGSNFWCHFEGTTTIHAGQTRRVPYSLSLASTAPIIRVSWTESGGVRNEREFHIG